MPGAAMFNWASNVIIAGVAADFNADAFTDMVVGSRGERLPGAPAGAGMFFVYSGSAEGLVHSENGSAGRSRQR